MNRSLLSLCLALSLSACSQQSETKAENAAETSKVEAAADAPKSTVSDANKAEITKETAVEAAKPAKPQRPPQAGLTAGGDLEFTGPITWTTWESAREEAAKSGKYTMLLVYSTGCPRCRELAPALDDPEFGELSQKVAMVRQRSDVPSQFLSNFNKFGGYVPRIFLIDPEGNVREDLVSDHPRFPYFYALPMLSKLKANLRSVAK